MAVGETMLSRLTGTLKNFFGIGPKTTRATLSASGLTAARTFTLPDVAGTVVVASPTTAGQILYWNGSAWTVLAVPTGNGQALRWDSANNRPSWTNRVFSRAVLGSTFNGTGATGVFQATGLSITIPAAGDYEIEMCVRTLMQDSTAVGGSASVRLALNGVAITNTEMIGSYSPNSQFVYDTVSQTYRGTFAASDVISVQFAANYTGTPSAVRGVYSDATGRSSLSYNAL